MNDIILCDFSKAMVGDNVYSLLFGDGKIFSIEEGSVYPIKVEFEEMGMFSFMLDGRSEKHHKTAVLYYGKPKIEVPPPPKRMVEKEIKVWAVIKNGKIYLTTKKSYTADIWKNDGYMVVEFKKMIEVEE